MKTFETEIEIEIEMEGVLKGHSTEGDRMWNMLRGVMNGPSREVDVA